MTVAPPNYDTIIKIEDALSKDSDDQGNKKSTRTSTSKSTFLPSFLRHPFLFVTLMVVVLGCSVAFFLANTATHQDQVATSATTTSLFRLDSKGGGTTSDGGDGGETLDGGSGGGLGGKGGKGRGGNAYYTTTTKTTTTSLFLLDSKGGGITSGGSNGGDKGVKGFRRLSSTNDVHLAKAAKAQRRVQYAK